MNKIISISKTNSIISDYVQLIKPRLVSLVLLSTATGYYLGLHGGTESKSFFLTLLGTALIACGSMALNELFERDIDAKMVRTQNRPLPAGRLSGTEAFIFGFVFSALGFITLTLGVNKLAALVAFATWFGYLFVYTPLKTKTSLSTIVGAVPGALPPLIGWAASYGHINLQAVILFLIIFFWQMPHFLSIAWIYKDDYERAGLPMLSVIDREGSMVARQMILNMCALMPVSLLPTILGMTGIAYFFGAFMLGLFFAAVIIHASGRLDTRARNVLRGSIAYLSVLLLLMTIDKI